MREYTVCGRRCPAIGKAWSSHPQTTPHKLSFSPKESLPPGSSETWPTWSSLNRLRTGTGRCKSLMQKWGFNEDGQTMRECGDEQTMKHLLVCPVMPQPCTNDDLEEFNPELDHAPSIGRESCSDSTRRIQIRHTDDFPSTGTRLVRCTNLSIYIRYCVSMCLSDETLTAVVRFYLVSMIGEVRYSTSLHWT